MRKRHRLLFVGYVVALVVAIDAVAGALFIPTPTQSFRVPDPYYHHGFASDVETTTTWAGRRYPMITNSLGFRDRTPREVALQSDEPRTVLLGDSFVEGLGFPYDDTVAGAMERRLRALGDDREILNAAAVSYSPLIYNLKTRYLLEEVGLVFDELIVFIDVSDIQDEVTYEGFVPTLGRHRRFWPWAQSFLDHHSVLWRLTRLSGHRKPVSNRFRFKRDADINVWMENTQAYVERGAALERGRWQWTINRTFQRDWANHGLALARSHMTELVGLAREHEVALTVVVYPSPVQIYSNDRNSLHARFWRAFCAEEDVSFVDLFPVFFRAGRRPAEVYRRYFIEGDMHWNAAGHALVAAAVVDARATESASAATPRS